MWLENLIKVQQYGKLARQQWNKSLLQMQPAAAPTMNLYWYQNCFAMLRSPRKIHPSNQKSIIKALQLQTLHRGTSLFEIYWNSIFTLQKKSGPFTFLIRCSSWWNSSLGWNINSKNQSLLFFQLLLTGTKLGHCSSSCTKSMFQVLLEVAVDHDLVGTRFTTTDTVATTTLLLR